LAQAIGTRNVTVPMKIRLRADFKESISSRRM
jgi:hypothetical protein